MNELMALYHASFEEDAEARRAFHLNEYLTDRAFGGGEEGGWWYDTGVFVKCHGAFPTREAAFAARDALDDYLAERREGLEPSDSVRCTGWPDLLVEQRPGRELPGRAAAVRVTLRPVTSSTGDARGPAPYRGRPSRRAGGPRASGRRGRPGRGAPEPAEGRPTMSHPPNDAATLAAALSERAEAVCRRYLPAGRRQGRYWVAGDVHGAKGRSLFVRLRPPGVPGKWTDAATGEHGDLLDLSPSPPAPHPGGREGRAPANSLPPTSRKLP